VKENGMRFARVRAPQDDQISFFDLLIGTRPATRTEYCRQTGDTRRVSSAIATVDVVAADDQTRELLGHEIRLVGSLRATEQPERARA